VFHQAEKQLPATVVFQIDGQALLVAVEAGEKTGAEPGKVAGVVAPAGPFDLPDLGAQVGKDQAAGRAHDVVAEFEHAHPGQRQGRLGWSPGLVGNQLSPPPRG
jgi:hypothetical protein